MALFPSVGRRRPKLRLALWVLAGFLVLGILLHLFPFYYMIVTSLKGGQQTLQFPPTLWPHPLSLQAWRLVFSFAFVPQSASALSIFLSDPFYVYFLNSLFIAVISLALSLPITAAAAYANSKLQSGRTARLWFLFFIGTMMVPSAVTLIPSFLLTRHFPFALPNAPYFPGTQYRFPTLPVWNTPWGVILPAVFAGFNFLLFKGFFDTIPDSVIQAARVDGGSEFNIFRRIVFRMSVPVFAVAAYFSFSGTWDSFLWPLIELQTPNKVTAGVAIYQLEQVFTSSGATNSQQAAAQFSQAADLAKAGLSWDGLIVLGILQSIPIFLSFLVCRRYLLKGIQLKGLK